MGYKKLGIAISGGGARLLSAMGAIQVFQDFGLAPDAVAGCSMGAIIAALWKAGYSGREMLQIFKTISFRKVVSWRDYLAWPFNLLSRFGRFSTAKLGRFVDRYLTEDPERANSFALYLYAFDLCTGGPVFWPHTELPLDLKKMVLASSALFPLFEPVRVEDAEGRIHYLTDGGYYSPVPAEVLKRKAGCDTVIAITYRDSRRPAYRPIHSFRTALRRMKQGRWMLKERQGLKYADQVIVIPTRVGGLDYGGPVARTAYDRGYRITARWLEQQSGVRRGGGRSAIGRSAGGSSDELGSSD